MSRYLVVAHQTATSSELLQRLLELTTDDPHAAFTLLVPASPVTHLLVWEEGETQAVAQNRAREAKALFESSGLDVVRTLVGDGSPLLAIGDELRRHPYEYDVIVLSTLPPGISRWLRLDVYNQAERKFNLPVIRVVAQRVKSADAAGTHRPWRAHRASTKEPGGNGGGDG